MKKEYRIWLSRTSVVLVMLALSLPALAALGGDVTSVQQDKAQMKGTLKTTKAAAFTVHQITAPGNTVINEYVSPAGKVFAIVWHGQFVPNMQQLLGSYYKQFSDAAAAKRESHLRQRGLNVQQSDLVIQNGGHPRAYFGKAYVPSMFPQGVTMDEIQ